MSDGLDISFKSQSQYQCLTKSIRKRLLPSLAREESMSIITVFLAQSPKSLQSLRITRTISSTRLFLGLQRITWRTWTRSVSRLPLSYITFILCADQDSIYSRHMA